MQKKIKKLEQSNYEIELITDKQDMDKAQEQVIKHFQKDFEFQWFRKGSVPIDIVKKNIKPEYLTIWAYETIINQWVQEIIKETPTLRLIGEPYDLNQKEAEGKVAITLKLDVFPEAEVINEWRKKEKFSKINSKPTDQEIQNALMSLKRNYADYKDVSIISLDTISKIWIEYLDKDGNQLSHSHTYVWEQEFTEDEFFKKEFLNKKRNESREQNYEEKKLPVVLQNKKAEHKPHKIHIIIEDIKQIVLPEINNEMLLKLFWPESKVKTEKQLIDYIKESIENQKFEMELMKRIDEYLNKVKSQSIKVTIPQTLTKEEYRTRIKSLEERFGSADKLQQYFKQLWEEKEKAFHDDIHKAAWESLEKFFILQKVLKLFEIDVNLEKSQNLEAEKKLYEKLLESSKPAKS